MQQTALIGRTLKNSDSRGEVVDTSGSADSSSDDRGRGNEIVGEAVVQVSLSECQQICPRKCMAHPRLCGVTSVGFNPDVIKRTWSSKTSLTLSNSFSYLFQRHMC
jgi:hypothetical protein